MGLSDLISENLRIDPPFGSHPVLYRAVDAVIGPDFRKGPNNEPAEQRRDDYLLGTALFLDTPKDEKKKTRVYFAADMIAQAQNRDVDTQTAVVNNYTSIISEDDVEDSQYDTKIGIVAHQFYNIESKIEDQIQSNVMDRSEIVEETLEGVRDGQSFLVRWGDARQEFRDDARNHGQGKYRF
ncbi:hypothetical protein [Halorussus halophilus]|uniref:hypothetical protein n=1 Tax=Halorussus halophilus TaxID=2650975 RepID=UPI00130147F4|nr:hypothetical protein [Halorussus halophilus]